MSVEDFAALPTRNLDLSRETRTVNSVTVGGEIAVIPHRAVTVGMKEILAAGKLRFYCNRPWQSAGYRSQEEAESGVELRWQSRRGCHRTARRI